MSKVDPKVPKYTPTKEHIKHVLLYFYRLKKDAIEAQDIIRETYGEEHAVSQSFCEHWYKRFESGNFSFEEENDTSKEIK